MVFYYNTSKLYNFNVKDHEWSTAKSWHLEFLTKITEGTHTNVFIDNEVKKENNTTADNRNLVNEEKDIFTELYTCNVSNEDTKNYTRETIKFNNEQQKFIDSIENIYNNSTENSKNFKLCLLLGPAGTGKTTILKYFAYDPDEKFEMYYLTTQNILCNDFKKRVHFKYTDRVFTIASFIIKLFSINFYKYIYMCRRLINRNCIEPVLSYAISLFNKDHTSEIVEHIQYNSIISNITETETASKEPPILLIFVDEFSQIQSSIIKLLINIMEEYANVYRRKVILTICGDCYQIQPVASLKCNTDHSFVDFLFTFDQQRSSKYHIDKIAPNSLCILDNNYDSVTILSEQMRNKSNVKFLDGLLEVYDKKNPRIDNVLSNYIMSNIDHEVIYNRRIDFKYKLELFINYPYRTENRNENMYLKTIEWYNLNNNHINSFIYFSYTNTDAHYINITTFYVAHNNFKDYISKIKDDDEKKSFFLTLQPRLSVINFANSKKDSLKYGVFQSPSLPVLPLIIGMHYKVLRWIKNDNTSKKCNNDTTTVQVEVQKEKKYPSSGSIVTLLAIEKNVLHVLHDDTFYTIKKCYFQQNLFCSSPKKFQYMENNKIVQADFNSQLLLYGFPLQLSIGDTIQSSIGRTINNNMYANINGASFEEIYVLFSRLTDEYKILGLVF